MMRNKKLKKQFCYSCGAVLVQTLRTYAFDGDTGAPLVTVDIRCPNAKFFTLKQHPLTLSEASVNYLSGF